MTGDAKRSKEWSLGFNAWVNEGSKAVNPFDEGTRSHSEWNKGYTHAMTYDTTPSGVTRKYRTVKDHVADLDDLEDDYAIWPSGIFLWYSK